MPPESRATTRRPRLVWRVAAVTGAMIAIWVAILEITTAVFDPDHVRGRHVALAVAATALTVPMVMLARRFLDRRPWAGLGLSTLREGWRPLLLGAGCYLVPAGAALATFVALGFTTVEVTAPAGEVLLVAAGLLLLVLLYEALPEELAFRGYLYRNLAASLAPWLAMVTQAVLFAGWGTVVHGIVGAGAGELPGRFLLFFFAALVIGTIRVVTGALWACVGFHLAFQTSQQLLGSMWAQVGASDPALVEQLALGLVPLALAVPLLLAVRRRPVDWRTPQPDPPRAGAR